MGRLARVALIVGASAVAIGAAVFVWPRLSGRRTEKAVVDEDTLFTVFTPGGSQGFWCNGPVGWLTSKLMPIVETNVYETVAEMLDLRPEDDLLDIGCGPGGFVAAKAQHVRRVVGIDTSPLMLRAAGRRLADRIAAGTTTLVHGNAAALPFSDGSFSAAAAIYAPASMAEVFRVLRPGGRLVVADPEPARVPSQDAAASGGLGRWGEADYRRMFADTGFTDLAVRFNSGGLFAFGRKPTPTERIT